MRVISVRRNRRAIAQLERVTNYLWLAYDDGKDYRNEDDCPWHPAQDAIHVIADAIRDLKGDNQLMYLESIKRGRRGRSISRGRR